MRSPADIVIETWGTVRATARRLGYSKSYVHSWQTRRQGERVGCIPQEAIDRALTAAREDGIKLTLEQLHYGEV